VDKCKPLATGAAARITSEDGAEGVTAEAFQAGAYTRSLSSSTVALL